MKYDARWALHQIGIIAEENNDDRIRVALRMVEKKLSAELRERQPRRRAKMKLTAEYLEMALHLPGDITIVSAEWMEDYKTMEIGLIGEDLPDHCVIREGDCTPYIAIVEQNYDEPATLA